MAVQHVTEQQVVYIAQVLHTLLEAVLQRQEQHVIVQQVVLPAIQQPIQEEHLIQVMV